MNGSWRTSAEHLGRGPLVTSVALGVAVLLAATGAVPPAEAQGPPPTTVTFDYTGAMQGWTVPPGVSRATFDLYGAQGGSGTNFGGLFPGGAGGRATATLAVTSGSTVTIMVGGKGQDWNPDCGAAGGFNGGGDGGNLACGRGGGGASDVRIGGTDLAHRVLVAGGGGGASINLVCNNAGDGGGLTGGSADCDGGGAGGNQTGRSGSGQLGVGSKGADCCDAGGGGGGGYYGGAGGGHGLGGGGGSGFGPAGTTFQNGAKQGHGRITVTYALAPTVTSIRPSEGPAAGGTVVTISGANLTTALGPTTISFGATPAASMNCASATRCTATSPPGMGMVGVTVTNPGGTSNAVNFLYISSPLVTDITPATGPTAGGTAVTIRGSGFVPRQTSVHFGTSAATGVNCSSATTCTAISPPGMGAVGVTVTNPLGTSNAVLFIYSTGPTTTTTFQYTGAAQTWTVPAGVTHATFDIYGAQGGDLFGCEIRPTCGGRGGQATATLSVTPGATITIMVGGQGQALNDCQQAGGAGGFNGGGAGGTSSVICPAGPGGGGASDVRIGGTGLAQRVLVAGGGGGASNLILPGCGETFGGDGGGLAGGTAPCDGGGSGGDQTGTSGSGQLGQGGTGGQGGDGFNAGGGGGGYYGGAGGAAQRGGGGGSGFGPAGAVFQTGVNEGHGRITVTYPLQPTLTSISPSQGPAAGGTVVTLTGMGFSTTPGATSVAFGTNAATNVNCSSATSCAATSPAGMGTVSVRVTVGGQTSPDTPADDFTYTTPTPPTVTGLSPNQGPAAGGTVVTITGSGFSPAAGADRSPPAVATAATLVSFGSVPATSVSCSSTTQCTATSPPGMGMVHVRVTVAGQQSAETAADTFTYLAAPTLTALVPAQGPAGGGTLVTLSGSGFASGRGGTSVRFGSSVATNVSCASATQCTATSPAGMGMVSVVVETATGTSNALPFTYQTGPMAPTVTGLDPSSGPAAGGTLMTITGSGFSPTPGATTISFGGVAAADASCSSATQCTATSPPGIGTVSVRVTVGGQQSADTPADDFTYLPFGPAPRTSAPAAVPPTLAPPSPPVRR